MKIKENETLSQRHDNSLLNTSGHGHLPGQLHAEDFYRRGGALKPGGGPPPPGKPGGAKPPGAPGKPAGGKPLPPGKPGGAIEESANEPNATKYIVRG